MDKSEGYEIMAAKEKREKKRRRRKKTMKIRQKR